MASDTPIEPDALEDLAAVYATHAGFVWSSLARMGVPASALDDALQDVFMIAHRKLPEFEGRASHRTWLFAIAYRVAAKHRRRGPAGRVADERVPEVAGSDDVEDAVARRQALALVDRILAGLDERRRAVFVMADVHGMSAPEIADALGVKLNTVYSRLRKARLQFRRGLARQRARVDGRRRRDHD